MRQPGFDRELQAEADLRESERRFRTVLDAMPAAVYATGW